ncbi:MAG: FAD-dependent oxidoreductase [Planctomycetota bacterium]
MEHKKVMVVGGGIAGIQAALDLAEMGVEVFLVEQKPSIGGRMAQLDKTFPTNDCAMCILSPKLVEAGANKNIHIIANAEVQSVEGEAGNFHAHVLKRARYVDETRCTGCGICMSKCPVRIPDQYNMGLNKTKCIRIPFPQAVPAVPIISKEHCIYMTKGKCRICEKFCEEKVIDYEQKDELLDIEVGSIILAVGSQEFDAKLKGEYSYGTSPNVLTSIEFERLLSASGPTQGHVLRPSDQKEPWQVAFLQCIGSRDMQAGGSFCSAICCMQAAKDAIIMAEHLSNVDVSIFNMDIRAQGKDFDKFITRAQSDYGARFIRARVSAVEINPANDNLRIRYDPNDGGPMREEEFDMVVLSVGLHTSEQVRKLASKLDIELNQSGFVSGNPFDPVLTSRDGVFVCGTMTGPRDIPETVMQASGAAGAAASLQAELPSRRIKAEYPQQRDIRGESPRVGVFICKCGINIASTVDVPGVVEFASGLPWVEHAQELMFSCAGDSQRIIAEAIREKDLNRVVVSACTPRTHEPLFQGTLQSAGINPYLFEFANIREHCSWVHQKEPDKATEKAKMLTKMAVNKVIRLEPLSPKTMPVNHDALVVGGGVAGLTAALELANHGSKVHLVERQEKFGGNFRDVHFTMDGQPSQEFLNTLIEQVTSNPNIHTYLNSDIAEVQGFVGNFKSKIRGNNNDEITEIEHGAVIVATGASELETDEYLRGREPGVVTLRELETALAGGGTEELKEKVNKAQSVVLIQCVGSRCDERPYCSRICCNKSIKNALKLKELNPDTNIYVLYRDIRAYGLHELDYRQAREKGIIFIRYQEDDKPVVTSENGALKVHIFEPTLRRKVVIEADLIGLAVGIAAGSENKVISQMLKIPLNSEGFFLEAHVKLRPVDFATDGVFVCGLAHYPKDVSESVAQARAAAARAMTVLSKDTIEAEGKVSQVRAESCAACGACVAVCPFAAIEIDEINRVAVVNESLCKGCGACSATCRSCAIDLRGFRDEQLVAAMEAIVEWL